METFDLKTAIELVKHKGKVFCEINGEYWQLMNTKQNGLRLQRFNQVKWRQERLNPRSTDKFFVNEMRNVSHDE